MIYAVSAMFSILVSCLIPNKCITKKNISKRRKYIIRLKKRTVLILCSMLFPMLVSALRYGLGTDYFYTYIPQFNNIANGGRGYYEIGFYFLNRFVSLFTDDGQWIIAICSVITIGIIYREIFRMAKNYQISILILYLSFVYFISLNNVRQSLASAILLLAAEALINGEKFRFIVWVLLASSIHRVSIIFLVLIIADKVFFSAWIYLLVTIVMFGIGKIIAPWLLSILVRYIPRLALYLHANELKMYNERTIGRAYICIQFVIMIVYVYFDYIKKKKSNKLAYKDEIEWNIAKISQCAHLSICAFDGVIPATYRISRIFMFLHFILLPNVIYKNEKNKNNRIMICIMIVIMYSFLFFQGILSGAEEVFPYKSIFDV